MYIYIYIYIICEKKDDDRIIVHINDVLYNKICKYFRFILQLLQTEINDCSPKQSKTIHIPMNSSYFRKVT